MEHARPRFRAALWTLPALAVVAATLLVTRAFGAERIGGRVAPYRLRVSPVPAPDVEISFYTDRLTRAESALDRAALAGACLAKRKFGLAEEHARRSLENLPFCNVAARGVLARVAEARHDFRGAVEQANAILKEKPRSFDALSILVTSNLGLGRVDEAARAADELVDRLPCVTSYKLRAQAAFARGKEREAIHNLKRAFSVEDVGEIEASARARVLLGRIHLWAGRIDDARDVLSEAARIAPENAAALSHLGDVHALRGDRIAAERCFTDAYKFSGEPWHLAKKQGCREAAIEMLREELAKSAFGHRRQLAELLLDAGRKTESLAFMNDEVKLRRDWETLALHARALTANGRPREARVTLREALRSGIEIPSLHRLAADIERALGDETRARFHDGMTR